MIDQYAFPETWREKISEWKKQIDSWDQTECARFWRFAKSEHPVIQTPELFQYYGARFKLLGGMTPEISKRIGL